MKFSHKIVALVASLVLISGGALSSYARGWESLKSERAVESRLIVREADVEVRSGKGVIVVATSRPVAVKVYTILGQLISQDTLPAGTSCLTISGHGVYIVKVGDITCKVAL